MIDPSSVHSKEILPDIKQSSLEEPVKTSFQGRIVKKATANSPTLSVIKSLWFTALSMLTEPFSSRLSSHYAVASMHEDEKIGLMKRQALFKGFVIGEARNVAAKEVVRDKKDFEAAKSLLKECKFQDSGSEWFVDANATPKSACIDGICAGIRMDIARDFLVHKKSIEEIVAKNSKGGSAEAAANQAVYALMRRTRTQDQLINSDLLGPLRDLQNNRSNHPSLRCDFQAVEQTLCMLDLVIQKASGFDPAAFLLNPLPYTVRLLQLIRKGEIPLPRPDLKAFSEKGLQALAKQSASQEEMESFKWLVAFLECKQALLEPAKVKKEAPAENPSLFEALKRFALELFGNKQKSISTRYDTISDPLKRFVLSGSIENSKNIATQNAVASLRGLSVRSVDDILPFYQFSNDMEYLEQLRNLPQGTYGLSFQTGSGAHAITYIKNEDGSGYILDPNRHQLRASNMDQALALFSELLSTYGKPDNNNPFIENQDASHNLFICAFEASYL